MFEKIKLYSPFRIYGVFTFLLTLFLLIKKQESFLFFTPLSSVKLKKTIVKLGTSFIKLAQVLATRSDFFDEEYLEELKTLHDQIPPMSKKSFDRVFKSSFPKTIIFKKFDYTPIAAASIGQVHTAHLQDGTKVAVKLLREDVKQKVLADIKIISFFNKVFSPLFSFYTKNSIDAVISEFSKMIVQEVNFDIELTNLQKFSETYKESGILFPKPYEKYCSSSAIVMSFEEGFRFDDKKSICKYDIDIKAVIAKLVEFYTTQMLIKGYFHADPHPGNILITKDSQIIFLDFGMVKTVPNNTRIAIIELIKAANEQNYEAYISANQRLGTIAYGAPVDELSEFTEKMFEIFSNDNLDSESMQKLAFEVLETTRDFPFKLPSDAIYILRVSAIIEGLGTTYIENFNGIKDILPILQENIPKALGADGTILEILQSEIKDIPFLVRDFKTVIKKMSDGKLEVELSNNQVEYFKSELKGYVKPILTGIAFILAGFFTLLYDRSYELLALGLFGFGFFKIVYK